MGLFGKKEGKPNEGGLMDTIRCDEAEYLIWKWRPAGMEANTTKKETAIRYGSSLSVKDGEVAVFLYHQKDGTQMDCIEGPYNDTIQTGNFPVLAGIVGLAFGGGTPFQAEVYYINLAGLIRVPFVVPYFDIFDPRLPEHPVSMAVRGSFMMGITDYKEFIKLHRLANFNMEEFKAQVQDTLVRHVKGVVANIPDGSFGGAPTAGLFLRHVFGKSVRAICLHNAFSAFKSIFVACPSAFWAFKSIFTACLACFGHFKTFFEARHNLYVWRSP